ncbi:uncharacterized protein F5147DRAFT_658541 [Suillus discolor]|uniref:Uncharacterized protein n=1 Tax=Suillus discolor TaxID=1912936 RepID=A0A9P7EUI1_9AGAM|nr:uncharacterized protein F5147DRAFT_658541 [Suillus discolor]KAG2088919.1 hypothetical protein F5147DRAFT_658541 [Suillus discolor]
MLTRTRCNTVQVGNDRRVLGRSCAGTGVRVSARLRGFEAAPRISQAAKLLSGMWVQQNKFSNMQSDPMTTRTTYMFRKLSLCWQYWSTNLHCAAAPTILTIKNSDLQARCVQYTYATNSHYIMHHLQCLPNNSAGGFYAATPRLIRHVEYFIGGQDGNILISKGGGLQPTEFIIHDGNFNPSNVFHGRFADVRLSCQLTAGQ